ncbi:branched-chain amino acid ABC transporter permease [Cryptosporangium japonicum]|uniref:Branched-chain amino acid ABC transporter permease n=1 Tax=Cryptosporangium japonicum TaxID=80872 RepID=A0ABP3DN45_9ACTN
MRRPGPETLLAVPVFVALFYVPYLISGYTVFILAQYMLYGVLALTLCLLWGLGGMVSFGQGAFFALGAYALGITVRELDSPWLGLLLAVVLGAGVAGAVGWFLFSANVRDSYFVLVTLALSTIVYVVANAQSGLTGGFNGMFVPRVSFGPLSLSGDLSMYYLAFAVTLASYVGARLVQASAFGRVLVSIRENEDRTQALGYPTALYKTAAFALSGAVAAVAGALYATDAGFVSPSLGGVLFSTTVVVWVAVGGRNSFLAALVGAIGISALSNALNSVVPEYWQLLLGVLFVLVIVFFRRGVVGSLLMVGERRHARR